MAPFDFNILIEMGATILAQHGNSSGGGGGGGSINEILGQVKPDGIPTGFNFNSLLFPVPPIFYGIDTGLVLGAVDIADNNNLFLSNNLPGIVSSAYGNSQNWILTDSNTSQPLGTHSGMWLAPSNAVHVMTDLQSLGTGNAITFATTFYPFGPNDDGGFVAGRPSRAGENQPFAVYEFTWENNAPPGCIVGFYNNNGAADATDVSHFNVGYNNLSTAVLVFENVANGLANVTLYVNGTLVGTENNVALQDMGPDISLFGRISAQQDSEEQFMFGTTVHVDTTANFNSFNGQVFQQFLIPAAWNANQVAYFHANPYNGLLYDEGLSQSNVILDTVSTMNVAGGNSATISWTHTPNNTPSAVGVFLFNYESGGTISSVSYGGVPMIIEKQQLLPGNSNLSVWGLASPHPGAQTVLITLSGKQTDLVYIEGASVSVTGSNTTHCFRSSNTGIILGPDGGSHVYSQLVFAWNGDLVVDINGTNLGSGGLTPNNEQINIWGPLLVGGNIAAGSIKQPTSATWTSWASDGNPGDNQGLGLISVAFQSILLKS